jgi:transketolase
MLEFPDSVINVGIAEQNMVGIAAGMSLGGMVPFTANAAPFLMGRSNEQVKTDICYSNTNVKLVGLNPGFAYGSLGPTHHCLDDLSTALSFGNIEVFAPCDPEETQQITRYAFEKNGPVYIRLDSFQAENIHPKDYKFLPGEPVIITQGSDVSIISTGTIVHETLAAAVLLKKNGISARIINVPSLRPLNKNGLSEMIKTTSKILTVEEHSTHGGLGDLVSEIILEKRLHCEIKKLGAPTGTFAPASPRDDIKREFNLHSDGIKSECISLLKD